MLTNPCMNKKGKFVVGNPFSHSSETFALSTSFDSWDHLHKRRGCEYLGKRYVSAKIYTRDVLRLRWFPVSLLDRQTWLSLSCFFSTVGARNGQDKLEGNISGFAESFTCSSGLQFNKYKDSSQLVTDLPGSMLRGSDVGFRPRSMSRLQHQAGLNVSVTLMQLYWFGTSSCLVSVSLRISLHWALLGEANVSSRNVVILRLFQEKRYFSTDYAFSSAFLV